MESYSQPGWTIARTVIDNTITERTYANYAQFNSKWTDRYALFGLPAFSNNFSIQFDGNNDYLFIPHQAALSPGRLTPFSVSMWVKSTKINTILISKLTATVGWELNVTSGDLTWDMDGTGTTADRCRVRAINAGTVIYNGEWHHICVTWAGTGLASGVKMYLDGTLLTNTVTNDGLISDPKSTIGVGIGADPVGSGTKFQGNIDEVSIWDSALSAADVAALRTGGVPANLYTHPNGSKIAWWRMGDGASFPVVPDVISGFNGVMTNMTQGDVESEVP